MDKRDTVIFADKLRERFPYDFKATLEEVYNLFRDIPLSDAERALDSFIKMQRFVKRGFSLGELAKDAAETHGYGDMIWMAAND